MRNLNKITRRNAMTSLAGIGGALAVGVQASKANDDHQSEDRYIVDAHSHIWTRDVEKFPLAKGVTVDDLSPPSFTTEELLEVSGKENVRRVVLIAHNPFYGFDNTYMIDAVRRYPGKFAIVGAVDDSGPHPDRKMKELLKQGVTGFRIVPGPPGQKWLDRPGMKMMWRTAAQTQQAICCLIDSEYVVDVNRMCRKFPETRVVIDHFARIGIDGTIGEKDLKDLTDLAQCRNTFVKISAYYALGKKLPPYDDLVPMIQRLYEAFGAQRLMWASDAPYQMTGENTYGTSLSLVRDRIDFVTDNEREWLLRKTAEKVFFEIS